METSESLENKYEDQETVNHVFKDFDEMDEIDHNRMEVEEKKPSYGCKLCGDIYFDTLQLCKDHLHEFHKIKMGVAANEFIKFSENTSASGESFNDASKNSNHSDENSNHSYENSNHSNGNANQSTENSNSGQNSNHSCEKLDHVSEKPDQICENPNPVSEKSGQVGQKANLAREISALSGEIAAFAGESPKNNGGKSPNHVSENYNEAIEIITLEDTPKKTTGTSDVALTPRKKGGYRKVFPCKLCGLNYFRSRKNLLTHIRKIHKLSYQAYSKNNFKGVIVAESGARQLFKGTPYRKQAKKPATSEKTVKCDLCEEKFRNTPELRQHAARAHEKLGPKRKRKEIEKFQISNYQITCEICGKNFESKKYYQLHVESHGRVSPTKSEDAILSSENNKLIPHMFPCRICDIGFHTQISIKKHITLHEPLPNNIRKALIAGKNFPHKKCQYCQKSFFNYYEFNKHVREHETLEPEVSIICEVDTPIQPAGQYQLEHSLQLQQQQRLLQLQQQPQLTKHPLPIPENLFQQQIKILKVQPQTQPPPNHKKIISVGANGKRVINKKCEYCEKFFTNYYQYHKHVETHKGTAPTKVPKIMFKTNIANGQNIIRCNDCLGQFMNNNDFNKHKTVSKPYKPAYCTICMLPCQNECSMVQHTIEMHPNSSIVLNKRKNESTTNSAAKKARGSTSFPNDLFLVNQVNSDWSPYETLTNPLAGPSYGIPPGLNVEVKKVNDPPQTIGGIRLPKGLEVSLKGVRIPQGLTVSVQDGVRIPAGLQISVRNEPVNVPKKVVIQKEVRPASLQNVVRPASLQNVVRSVGSINVVRPVGNINVVRSVGSINVVRPGGNVNVVRTAGTVNVVRPAGNVNVVRPAGNVNVVRPAGTVNVARPAGSVNVARPAGSVNVARPVGSIKVARPISVQNIVKPVCGVKVERPVSIQNVVRPVCVRKEAGTANLPKNVSVKKEELIIPDFLDD